ncbi:FAD-binding oxidoreductase [Pedobacter panaciterrae]
MIKYTLKVINVIKETDDTITLCFKQPALRKIKYEAGQYLTLIFRINGRRYIRPYSFSSAPLADTELAVTVKRVPNGIVSNHIHDMISPGDSIEVMSPLGHFVYNRNNSDDFVFLWGAGSGITPLISIAKQILIQPSSARVNLIYGNKNNETTIFSNIINELLKEYPDRFRVWHFQTQSKINETSPFLIRERINKNHALSVMRDINGKQSFHYICGPGGVKESVKGALQSLDIPHDQIFSEDFELIRDPRDFEDIHTQIVNLKFDNQHFELEVVKGKSVLETALDAGIELPYSCQTGDCNTCLAKAITGSLKMIGLGQKRNDLSVDQYLLCCSHPMSNNVYLEV